MHQNDIGRIVATGNMTGSTGLREHPLRILGSFAVVFLVAGDGRYSDESGHVATVNSGDLIIVLPDMAHTYGPPAGQTWDQLYVVFEGPVFDVWRAAGLLDPPVRHADLGSQWVRDFTDLVVARPAGLSGACRLQLLLAEALAAPTAGPDGTGGWLGQAKALLDADIRREKSLEQMAAAMHMSYEGFRKRFRRLARVSPARYRSQQAIDHACQLMVEGRLTDKEISAALGFCDEFHFSHRFRQLTGRSPRQFRSALPRPERTPADEAR